MNQPFSLFGWIVVCFALLGSSVWAQPVNRQPEFRAALVRAEDLTAAKLKDFTQRGFTAVGLVLDGSSASDKAAAGRAASLVQAAHLDLYYWVEVARCPELADANPQWMASLQTHDEWRRFFPDAAKPAVDEVAKTYPWVPILSREPFAAQLTRVKGLLRDVPVPEGVFLNDLQGAPSACGCGNPLCRWTSDYGKRRTTVPLEDDAATLFVNAIKRDLPNSEIVPVWTTECEKHDGAKDGQCAGVGCFEGICWKAYTRQLMPLQAAAERIGVLALYKSMQRDSEVYGTEGGWVRHAVETFQTMPPKHGGEAIAALRLITVLQGWNLTAEELAAQIDHVRAAGVHGYVVSFTPIEQGWEPRIVKWK